MGIENFWAFLIAGILLNLTPGQDTIFIIGQSISLGPKAGVMSALGIGTGSLFHTLAAALGLSAIITSSAFMFHLIKYLGAAYLIFLGIQAFLKKKEMKFSGQGFVQTALFSIYRRGILTNVLNPKVALFFLAFLPQFINPHYSPVYIPFIILGTAFTTTGTIWCLIIALFSSFFSSALQRNPKTSGWLQKISGSMFIGLGLNVALNRD
jgi:threonine/homoserine/homoserine lactone efflux protein